MTNSDKRWLEIRFYLICQKIFEKEKQLQDVKFVIFGLSTLGKYDRDLLFSIAQEILVGNYKPTEYELFKIADTYGISRKKLRTFIHFRNSDYTKIKKHNANDPPAFFPRLNETYLSEIKKFLDITEYIKEITLWTTH